MSHVVCNETQKLELRGLKLSRVLRLWGACMNTASIVFRVHYYQTVTNEIMDVRVLAACFIAAANAAGDTTCSADENNPYDDDDDGDIPGRRRA